MISAPTDDLNLPFIFSVVLLFYIISDDVTSTCFDTWFLKIQIPNYT